MHLILVFQHLLPCLFHCLSASAQAIFILFLSFGKCSFKLFFCFSCLSASVQAVFLGFFFHLSASVQAIFLFFLSFSMCSSYFSCFLSSSTCSNWSRRSMFGRRLSGPSSVSMTTSPASTSSKPSWAFWTCWTRSAR